MFTQYTQRLLLLALCLPLLAIAQVSRGPLVGALTHEGAKLYVRTEQPSNVVVEYATNSQFANLQTVSFSTLANRDNSGQVSLGGLQADQVYYYRVRVNGGNPEGAGQFRTFPQPGQPSAQGPLKIAFGSCQQRGARVSGRTGQIGGPTPEDSIFLPAAQRQPHVFIHLGDWAYPNTDIANADTIVPYTREMSILEEAYRIRYSQDSYPSQAQLFRNTAFDYIWDDCDYIDGGSGGKWVASKYGNPPNAVNLEFDPINRQNVQDAYMRYFPHYPLQDSANGIYHSYRMGNLEVFVLDLRANMGKFYDAFVYGSNGRFTFQPPLSDTTFTILGGAQRRWFFNALKNSTADWKIVVSSVTFHKGYDALLDNAINLQTLNIGGRNFKDLAYTLVEGWTGFRWERQALLDYIAAENIKNVVVLSGDSHTSAIDDGRNGGLPELMAANLTVENGEFLTFFPTLWNVCAQGVNGVPARETFGLVEAHGRDSLRLVLVDKANREICSHWLVNQTTARPAENPFADVKVFPNPASQTLRVEGLPIAMGGELQLVDISGRVLQTLELGDSQRNVTLQVGTLPRGLAILRWVGRGNPLVVKVVALQ